MSATVYEIITGQIISQLEKGVAPWRQSSSVGLPKNLVSGKVYRSINLFLLSTAGCEYFLTRNQAEELGGTIRGKGLPVVFWKMLERENKKTGETELTPFMRYYKVNLRCLRWAGKRYSVAGSRGRGVSFALRTGVCSLSHCGVSDAKHPVVSLRGGRG